MSLRTLAACAARAAGGLLAATAAALLLAGCGSLAPPASGATPAPEPVIRLEVQAPDELRQLLEKYLDLARLQQLRDDEVPDDAEWARLIGAAPAQARELLQTEGYFDAVVTAKREDGRPARVLVQEHRIYPQAVADFLRRQD